MAVWRDELISFQGVEQSLVWAPISHTMVAEFSFSPPAINLATCIYCENFLDFLRAVHHQLRFASA